MILILILSLTLANVFGTPFTEVTRNHWDKDVPEISILKSTYESEKDKPENPILNRRNGWHTDHSFKTNPPKATILHAHEIPSEGGHTRFCNTNMAYEDLPNNKKRVLDGLEAVHCYDTKRAPARPVARSLEEIKDTPDVIHPLIRTHDETKIKLSFSSIIHPPKVDFSKLFFLSLLIKLMSFLDLGGY